MGCVEFRGVMNPQTDHSFHGRRSGYLGRELGQKKEIHVPALGCQHVKAGEKSQEKEPSI